ncbi:MAG: hypothetical protein ACFCU8_04880 [Thermosynechococcaceae cyanobacterium]
MPLARTGIIVGLFISLAAITLQNRTPALSLMFLGMRSRPFPLGILIVGAVGVGILAGLILLFLINQQATEPRPRRPRPDRPVQPRSSQSRTTQPRQSNASDWDAPQSNDWGATEPEWGSPSPRSPEPVESSNPDLDDLSSIDEQRYARAGRTAPPPTPKTSSRDPNVSQQPESKGSVFEAEYRMVNPPGQDKKEEWEDLEDDFFE